MGRHCAARLRSAASEEGPRWLAKRSIGVVPRRAAQVSADEEAAWTRAARSPREDVRVDDLMSEAKGCREGTSVRECARLMKEENIGFVPICSANGEPVGAITGRRSRYPRARGGSLR